MLTFNRRPGWRIAVIDRTRCYITNDFDLEASAREGRTYRSREAAQKRIDELNKAEKKDP